LGKGSGPTWEAAKLQAAEEALRNFKSAVSQRTQKRLSSPSRELMLDSYVMGRIMCSAELLR